MGFGVAAKALLLLQLCMLLVGNFAADDKMIGSLPTSPASPPIHQTLKMPIVVQGGVYVRSCNHSAWEISPVPGATVQMQCDISGSPGPFSATTNQNGLFFLQGPESATIVDAHKCKVSLGPCPFDSCKQPSPFGGGAAGVNLTWPRFLPRFFLFSVGPWAYEPKCPYI